MYKSVNFGLKLLLLLMPLTIQAEPQQVSFQDNLNDFHQQSVQIRGFLYEARDGRAVLAAEPNIKSCCLNKVSIDRQVLVQGKIEITSNGYPVLLEGILLSDSEKRTLKDAKMIIEDNRGGIALLLMGIGLLLAIGGVAFVLNKRRI